MGMMIMLASDQRQCTARNKVVDELRPNANTESGGKHA